MISSIQAHKLELTLFFIYKKYKRYKHKIRRKRRANWIIKAWYTKKRKKNWIFKNDMQGKEDQIGSLKIDIG